VERDGTLWIGRKLGIFASRDDGATWSFQTEIRAPSVRRLASVSRLACRLLRHEVRALTKLSDGTLVAATRTGVFHSRRGDARMTPSHVIDDGRRFAPPMTLTVGPSDRVIWGEYDSRTGHGLAIRLFASDDRGASFEVAHVFAPGEVLHIHNLLFDAVRNVYWVFSGDFDDEPGIGCLSADLASFEWIRKGDQHVRVVVAFDRGDHLLYGTDSQLVPNAVVAFDKDSGRITKLADIDGSCIYACRFGRTYAITTSVEPSKVNPCRQSKLLLSRDGEAWQCGFVAEKDGWNEKYFQFGSLVLPRGESDRQTILFSGQAVRDVDNLVLTCALNESA
jgi:hypothetical protein